MKVKKYLVRDLKEAMKKIKEDLGDDAVILSTRRVKKGGFFGIGGKVFFEVTAVVEEKKTTKVETNTSRQEDIYRLQEILLRNRIARRDEARKSGNGVEKEIESIKGMIKDIKHMIITGKVGNLPPGISLIEQGLRYHEVDEEIINKIIEYLRVTYGDVDPKDADFQAKLADYMSPFIKTEEVKLKGKVVFIGPTGVGKTTTLAKLAARLKMEGGRSIAIVTFDTYRIAAADQLKTYAHILDIPIRVVYTPQEAEMELEALSGNYDVVLIDTAGRSQKNEIQMGELKALLKAVDPDRVFLLISMNCRYSDVIEILNRFKEASPTHVILSKMDETSAYGLFVNVPHYSGLPIAFVTNGQRVPDDLFEARSIELARILARGVLEYAGTG